MNNCGAPAAQILIGVAWGEGQCADGKDNE